MRNEAINQTELPWLIQKITKWHYDRNLIEGSSSVAQFDKLMEEARELSSNLFAGESPIDDIGDIIVVLLNIAERHGLSLQDCVDHAWNDIKDRTGKLNSETGLWEKDK